MRTADYEAFAASLCDADLAAPGFLGAPPGCPLEDRLAVYRNNVHVSLVESLADSFPIVRAQVGDDFFRAMARAHVQQHKPASPLLVHFGEEFPDFISSFGPAAGLPWLPDIARLERAWSQCWAAEDSPALPVTALAGFAAGALARARIAAHPAARIVTSPWPVASLWEGHQSPHPDLSHLDWRPESVLLTRPRAEVLLRRLDAEEAAFASALLAGDTIDAAHEAAPGVDAGALLGLLVESGFIREICR